MHARAPRRTLPPRAVRTFVLYCASLGALASASAQERVVLDWTAPPGCPSEAEVLEAVQARLIGKTLPPGQPVDATARIESAETGYTLALRVRSGEETGTRALSATDCSELGAATAIILALMVEGAEPIEPKAEPEPKPADPPPTPKVAAPAEPAPARDDFAPLLRARATLLGDLGVLPEASLGIGLELGVPLASSFELFAGAVMLFPSSVELEGRTRKVAELSMLAGRAAVAWLPLFEGAFRTGPTLAVEVGRVGGASRNVADGAEGHGLWLAALLGAEARLRVARFLAFYAEISVGLPARHVAFTVESLGTVHEIRSPFARARLGLVIGF